MKKRKREQEIIEISDDEEENDEIYEIKKIGERLRKKCHAYWSRTSDIKKLKNFELICRDISHELDFTRLVSSKIEGMYQEQLNQRIQTNILVNKQRKLSKLAEKYDYQTLKFYLDRMYIREYDGEIEDAFTSERTVHYEYNSKKFTVEIKEKEDDFKMSLIHYPDSDREELNLYLDKYNDEDVDEDDEDQVIVPVHYPRKPDPFYPFRNVRNWIFIHGILFDSPVFHSKQSDYDYFFKKLNYKKRFITAARKLANDIYQLHYRIEYPLD